MAIWLAIVLGLVQGATEFLPVSSSGHEVLAAALFGDAATLDGATKQAWVVLVHLASALAIFLYFAREAYLSLRTPVVSESSGLAGVPTTRFGLLVRWGWYVGLATIPAGVVYLLLHDWFEEVAFATPAIAGVALIVNGGWLFYVDRMKPTGTRTLADTPVRSTGAWRVLVVGAAQALALIPGLSRSGLTIGTGLLAGLGRQESVRFSFALGLVAILAATVMKADTIAALPSVLGWPAVVAGFVASFVASLASLGLLLALVRGMRLRGFAIYCVLAGITALVALGA